jgi:hypothetical protein
MKALGQFDTLPESGVLASREGKSLIMLFDFVKVEPSDDEQQSTPENFYSLESVIMDGPTDYGKIVSAIINDKYSADDVQAIIANYEEARSAEEPSEKEQEYLAEYAEYQEWRKHAKEIAKIVIAMKGV